MEKQPDINKFLYQKYDYRGKFTPENLVFNANLQELAAHVSYICDLETLGKLSAEDAYNQISELWQQLERSYVELGFNSEK